MDTYSRFHTKQFARACRRRVTPWTSLLRSEPWFRPNRYKPCVSAKKERNALFLNFGIGLACDSASETLFELVDTTASINNTLSTSVEWVTSATDIKSDIFTNCWANFNYVATRTSCFDLFVFRVSCVLHISKPLLGRVAAQLDELFQSTEYHTYLS